MLVTRLLWMVLSIQMVLIGGALALNGYVAFVLAVVAVSAVVLGASVAVALLRHRYLVWKQERWLKSDVGQVWCAAGIKFRVEARKLISRGFTPVTARRAVQVFGGDLSSWVDSSIRPADVEYLRGVADSAHERNPGNSRSLHLWNVTRLWNQRRAQRGAGVWGRPSVGVGLKSSDPVALFEQFVVAEADLMQSADIDLSVSPHSVAAMLPTLLDFCLLNVELAGEVWNAQERAGIDVWDRSRELRIAREKSGLNPQRYVEVLAGS